MPKIRTCIEHVLHTYLKSLALGSLMWYCDCVNIPWRLAVVEQCGCLYFQHCALKAMYVYHNMEYMLGSLVVRQTMTNYMCAHAARNRIHIYIIQVNLLDLSHFTNASFIWRIKHEVCSFAPYELINKSLKWLYYYMHVIVKLIKLCHIKDLYYYTSFFQTHLT